MAYRKEGFPPTTNMLYDMYDIIACNIMYRVYEVGFGWTATRLYPYASSARAPACAHDNAQGQQHVRNVNARAKRKTLNVILTILLHTLEFVCLCVIVCISFNGKHRLPRVSWTAAGPSHDANITTRYHRHTQTHTRVTLMARANGMASETTVVVNDRWILFSRKL